MKYKILFLMAFAIMLIGSVSAISASNFWTGVQPSAYYKFNESSGNATDYSGSGLNLTIFGNVNYTAGKIGNATNTTNIAMNSYLFYNYSSPSSSNWSFGTENFTIAVWWKVPSGTPLFLHNFPVGSWASTNGWSIYLLNTGAIRVTGNAADLFTSTNTGYNDNTFKRVVWVRAGSNNMIYVNGTNIQNFTNSNDYNANNPLIVGHSASGEGSPIIGGLTDELQIFKGYAWNQTTVTYDFNNGAGRPADIDPSANDTVVGQSVYNSTTYETSIESFSQNITLNNGTTISSATLIYNGTSYAGTATNTAGSNYTLYSSLAVPASTGNKNWTFQVNYSNGATQNLPNNNQLVASLNFSLCGASPQNQSYVNFTFKNETTGQETITASFVSSWTYWLGDGTVNKTLTFTNNSESYSYAFCSNPGNRTLYVQPSIVYANANSIQRTYAPGTLALTSTVTNTVLYLLPSSSSSQITFLVENSAGQPIEGAFLNITRSGFGSVASGTTDAAGSVTFYLNSLVSYTIIASYPGYSSVTNTITPTSSPYIITLGSSNSSSAGNDYSRGINFIISPIESQLNTSQVYSFGYYLNSTFWSLDRFGFTLRNSSGFVYGSNSSTAITGGNVTLNLNTGNNQTIFMDYFWVINGTYSNASTYWIITNSSGSEYSITNFVSRLKMYLTDSNDPDGLFGLKSGQGLDFGVTLIIFMIIMAFTGILSYKYGFTSESAVMIVLFGAVYFFDVGLGLIPSILSPVPFFPTILTFIILLIIILKEAFR